MTVARMRKQAHALARLKGIPYGEASAESPGSLSKPEVVR